LWQKGARFGKFWQALFILPWAIPEMIGAMMWLNIFMPEWGWLALAAQKYGPHFPFAFFVGWEQSTNLWLLVFLIPAIWYGFPFMMLASSCRGRRQHLEHLPLCGLATCLAVNNPSHHHPQHLRF
jgi:ABC-type sugar transport system permease subunit